jgi:hypothetical protein
MGKIIIQFTFPDLGKEVYEGVIKDLATAGHGNIPERLYHVSAQHGNDWHVTDAWESMEAFNKFGETLMPLHIKNGGTPTEPTILPVHNIIIPE